MSTQIEKLAQAGDTYADLVEFLEWISRHPSLALAEWLRTGEDGKLRIEPRLVPLCRSFDAIIYEYLGIDTQALERERRALLDTLRRGQEDAS